MSRTLREAVEAGATGALASACSHASLGGRGVLGYPAPDDPRWECHGCGKPMADVRNGKYLVCRTVGCEGYEKPLPAYTRFGSRLPNP